MGHNEHSVAALSTSEVIKIHCAQRFSFSLLHLYEEELQLIGKHFFLLWIGCTDMTIEHLINSWIVSSHCGFTILKTCAINRQSGHVLNPINTISICNLSANLIRLHGALGRGILLKTNSPLVRPTSKYCDYHWLYKYFNRRWFFPLYIGT